jgi:hypothetical protein
MSEPSGEEAIEGGRNPTQQRIDEKGAEDRPVDVDWDKDEKDEEDEEQ